MLMGPSQTMLMVLCRTHWWFSVVPYWWFSAVPTDGSKSYHTDGSLSYHTDGSLPYLLVVLCVSYWWLCWTVVPRLGGNPVNPAYGVYNLDWIQISHLLFFPQGVSVVANPPPATQIVYSTNFSQRRESWARICKRLWSSGIDSQTKPIWKEFRNRFLGLLKRLQIRVLYSGKHKEVPILGDNTRLRVRGAVGANSDDSLTLCLLCGVHDSVQSLLQIYKIIMIWQLAMHCCENKNKYLAVQSHLYLLYVLLVLFSRKEFWTNLGKKLSDLKKQDC